MKITDTLQDLGRPIAYHPGIARMLGDVRAAIFLAQLMYWWPKKSGETVYKSADEWEEETALSEKQQRTARKLLKELGIIEEEYERLKHRMHYTLNEERLNECWENYQSGHSPTAQTAVREPTNGQVATRPKGSSSIYTETTAETTPETTPESSDVDTSGGKPPSAMKDSIADGYQSAFHSVTPADTWGNFPAQRAHLNSLAKKTKAAAEKIGIEPESMAQRILQEYANLIATERGTFWKSAPFTPTGLMTRWDSVLSSISQQIEAEKMMQGGGDDYDPFNRR